MKILYFSLFLSLNFLFPFVVRSETVLEKIKRTGLLEVGVRENAVPFGYRDRDNNLKGVCLDFIQLLREELKKELQLDIISVKIYQSNLFNRFDIVANRTVDFECGPNSIVKEPKQNIVFSEPFFVTGTQLLIKRENRGNINISSDLQGIRIGVLRDTSTRELLMEKYPLATFQEFQGITGRMRGIQSLRRGTIDAFASDGILLIGEALLLGLSLDRDYTVIPENFLSCEYYGLILPIDDNRWRDFINRTIENSENRELFQRWFASVESYVEQHGTGCKPFQNGGNP